MKTREIGTTGIQVSELTFGAVPLGNFFREITDADSTRTVHAALAGGVTAFDTAPHYGLGLSESRLGSALSDRPRDEIVISSKVGRLLVPSDRGGLDDENFVVPATSRRVWDFSASGVISSFESSLDRLGMDRLDVAYLHDPDDHWAEASTGGISALRDLQAAGKVGAIGAGMNFTAMPTRFVLEHDVDIIMIAGRYTLLDHSALDDLLPAALERGTAIVAAGVFNSGILASSGAVLNSRFHYAPAPVEVMDRVRAIVEICERHDVPLPAAAIHFALLHPAVTSVALGMSSVAQVEANLRHLAHRPPPELWRDLKRAGLIREDAPTDERR